MALAANNLDIYIPNSELHYVDYRNPRRNGYTDARQESLLKLRRRTNQDPTIERRLQMTLNHGYSVPVYLLTGQQTSVHIVQVNQDHIELAALLIVSGAERVRYNGSSILGHLQCNDPRGDSIHLEKTFASSGRGGGHVVFSYGSLFELNICPYSGVAGFFNARDGSVIDLNSDTFRDRYLNNDSQLRIKFTWREVGLDLINSWHMSIHLPKRSWLLPMKSNEAKWSLFVPTYPENLWLSIYRSTRYLYRPFAGRTESHPDNRQLVASSIQSVDDEQLGKLKSEKSDDEIDCAICLEPIESDAASLTHCEHLYHRHCLESWALSKYPRRASCPICRK